MSHASDFTSVLHLALLPVPVIQASYTWVLGWGRGSLSQPGSTDGCIGAPPARGVERD